MAYKIEGAYLPNKEIGAYTITALVAPVAANSIMLSCGETVELTRQVEIMNAFKLLRDGIRDRQLMSTWVGVIYSAVDIDEVTIANRRTSADTVPFTDNDVILGISAEVMADSNQYTVMLDTAFDFLADKTLEDTLKGT